MRIQCPNCKYEGESKTFCKGSMLVELVLFLCFIIPGLIYSVWRSSSRYSGCPQCGWTHVVKIK